MIKCNQSVSDPGFLQGGGANPPGGANICQLHEIERIWTPTKGARQKFYSGDTSSFKVRWSVNFFILYGGFI